MTVHDRLKDVELDYPALLAVQLESAGVEVYDGAEGDSQAGHHRALSGAIVDHHARHRCQRRLVDAPEEDVGRVRPVWLGPERQETVPSRRQPLVVAQEQLRTENLPDIVCPLQVEGLIRQAKFMGPVRGVGQTARVTGMGM